MQEIRFIGLDVHKESISIAVAEGDGSSPETVATIPNDLAVVLKRLRALSRGRPVRCCYEAGPTGFGLCRALRAAGIECMVVAPSLVPRQTSDRIKTDRRDAAKLARFLRSGDLTEVQIPDVETEAMRDLERARDDAKNAERAARHQLIKFLLRHDRKYSGKTAWTGMHLAWIRGQRFEHEAQNRVVVDYLHAVEQATARVEQLTKDIAELVEHWSLKPMVKALQGLRGIQLISAVVLAAEIGDFRRFQTARAFMAYLGLVPTEHSSGERRQRGRITKSGNRHARRILVESAWSYRFRPAMSPQIRARNDGLPPDVRATAWKAQQRLSARYRKLVGRGKTKQQTVTALARELAGFVWHIARQQQPQAA
ncbi:MAG TPA: IS110 family transposase [Polyangiaceae bacterium]|jgi:transposase|nr:IS110 family transposase [Polyangiaceae bacterium]